MSIFKKLDRDFLCVLGIWLLTVALDRRISTLTVITGILAVAYIVIVGVRNYGRD